MANSKVIIDILSPNERTFNMLEFVLQQNGKGRFELGRGNRPDLVIVDCDKPEAKLAFRKYRDRFPKIPAVLLLNLPAEYDTFPQEDRIGAEFILCKPFAAKDFIAKIDECLGATPATQSVGNTTHHTQLGSAKLATLNGDRIATAENTLPLQISPSGIRTTPPHQTWTAQDAQELAYAFALESDIDMTDTAAVESICLKIDNLLLGNIMRGLARQASAQSSLCLKLRDGPSFYISLANNTVLVTGGNFDLLQLARQEWLNQTITVSDEVPPEDASRLQFGLEAFLWKLALYTYRGRLPEGTQVNEPVYLKYWPNLIRLEPTPNAMRIAALWCRQPVALAYLVRILNIPQSHVFNFYSAAHTVRFAGPAVRDADKMLLPSLPDEMDYSVIQSLDDKLVSPRQKVS